MTSEALPAPVPPMIPNSAGPVHGQTLSGDENCQSAAVGWPCTVQLTGRGDGQVIGTVEAACIVRQRDDFAPANGPKQM